MLPLWVIVMELFLVPLFDNTAVECGKGKDKDGGTKGQSVGGTGGTGGDGMAS